MRPTVPASSSYSTPPSPGPAASREKCAEPIQPIAGLLAFLFPGLGHWYLGYRTRGLGVAIGVLLLFLTGLFIGGIDTIDRVENRTWFYFYGQMWNGPVVFAVDYAHQHAFKALATGKLRDSRRIEFRRSAFPNETRDPATDRIVEIHRDPMSGQLTDRPPKIRSVGRITELGTLFIAVGGMLNLIAIIDALFKNKNTRSP